MPDPFTDLADHWTRACRTGHARQLLHDWSLAEPALGGYRWRPAQLLSDLRSDPEVADPLWAALARLQSTGHTDAGLVMAAAIAPWLRALARRLSRPGEDTASVVLTEAWVRITGLAGTLPAGWVRRHLMRRIHLAALHTLRREPPPAHGELPDTACAYDPIDVLLHRDHVQRLLRRVRLEPADIDLLVLSVGHGHRTAALAHIAGVPADRLRQRRHRALRRLRALLSDGACAILRMSISSGSASPGALPALPGPSAH